MSQKLRMILSLDEFDDEMITLSLQKSMEQNGYHDEIVGITTWQDKIVIATRGKILILDRDNHMEVRLREIMQHNESMLYGTSTQEEHIVNSYASKMAQYMGLHPNESANPSPRLKDFIREIRKR